MANNIEWTEFINNLVNGYSYLVFDSIDNDFFTILPEHAEMVSKNGLYQSEDYIVFRSKEKHINEEE